MTVSTIPSILERARALTKAQVWESLPETQRTSEPIKADDRPLQRLLLALRFQKLNFFEEVQLLVPTEICKPQPLTPASTTE